LSTSVTALALAFFSPIPPLTRSPLFPYTTLFRSWQTENGSILIAPLPGITTTKPGAATKPTPGISADVFDAEGNSVEPGNGGYLVITKPWPSMLRTVWGDDERFQNSYFGDY